MAQGVNGDLADITYYTDTTPVHYTTSNVPLADLNANMLVLDQKLEGWILTGDEAFSEAGDGIFTQSVAFGSTVNTAPRVSAVLADVTGTPTSTLHVSVLNRTTSGFDILIDAVSTAGAWTANVSWLADGR